VNFGQENQLISGSYYQNNYSQAENEQFTQIFEAITLKMVAALDAGEAAESAVMQAAVREHYEFCLRFWKPDRESYKSLALSFALPTGFNETYEGYRAGLGNYIYRAAVHFADTQL
jgi:hypothetical protein